MQVRANPNGKIGTCGCGRSPTGDCCGWHSLSEEDYRLKLAEWESKNLKVQQNVDKITEDEDLDKYRQQASQLWNDSCTSGRSEQ